MNSEFIESLRGVFGARAGEFNRLESLPPYRALRVNTLKVGVSEAEKLFAFGKKSTLSDCGYYMDFKPSQDPYFHAGLYYVQEPSAQSAVCAFKDYIGERVLDLCAAPGGKATQAAAYMNGRGVIFANEIDFKRALALRENIERMGVKNAVVTNNDPRDFARLFGWFDTVIIDAPCSGEGMMRKEKVNWSKELVRAAAARQKAIISAAVRLLQKGGKLLYSTCTFNRSENEEIATYIESMGFKPLTMAVEGGEVGIGYSKALRLSPLNVQGEGQFMCAFEKATCEIEGGLPKQNFARADVKNEDVITLKSLGFDLKNLQSFNKKNCFISGELPELEGLKVLGIGVSANPHAAVLSLTKDEAKHYKTVEIGERAKDYIKGLELDYDGTARGEVIVTYNGYPLGLARAANTSSGGAALKNKYPKSLRV